MIIFIKTKALIFPLCFSLMMLATLLWPIHALADDPICKSQLPGLSIPDAPGRDVAGTPVTSTLIVTHPILINDLNVIISTTHTYVGDLVFTLTHKVGPTLTSTVIISRPLKGQSVISHEVACSGDDIFVTLDDEALADIQVNCTEGTTGNDGTKAYIVSQSYRPYNPLSIFDTDTLLDIWELTITDNYQEDTGSLLGWCLTPNSAGNSSVHKVYLPIIQKDMSQ